MITKEQNALIKLVLAMNDDPKVNPERKKTRADIRLEIHKHRLFTQTKKNLC